MMYLMAVEKIADDFALRVMLLPFMGRFVK